MHDRRLNGEVLTFGNQGDLFMNAMTWWDHGTKSIWSQPWGAAIWGELEGESLTLLPGEVVPWSTWVSRHPQTKVLIDEFGLSSPARTFQNDFVIGVAIQEDSVGYFYTWAEEARVLNDWLRDLPIAVIVEPGTRSIGVYLRNEIGTPADPSVQVPTVLSFEIGKGGAIKDTESGSTWDVSGVAVDGPLLGASMQRVPYVTAYPEAWLDFFPNTRFWGNGRR